MTTDTTHAGRIALVVGAGSKGGIGFACATTLAEQGAVAALADLAGSDVESLAWQLAGAPRHSAHDVDVTDPGVGGAARMLHVR